MPWVHSAMPLHRKESKMANWRRTVGLLLVIALLAIPASMGVAAADRDAAKRTEKPICSMLLRDIFAEDPAAFGCSWSPSEKTRHHECLPVFDEERQTRVAVCS